MFNKISKKQFHFHCTHRPLFLDSIKVGSRYAVFSLSNAGDSFKANITPRYIFKPLVFLSFLPDLGIVTMSDASIYDKRMYGKEWFLLKTI